MQQVLSSREYYRQCEYAAYSSRLNPYELDARELDLVGGWLSEKRRAEYLNIRNGILRLWTRNPLVIVTREEATSIIKGHGHLEMIYLSHEWLARNGYINFGVVDIPMPRPYQPADGPRRKTIVVVGAGVAGLSCARQLTGLLAQFRERWNTKPRQPLPRILVLEGRNRVGGRVYSHPLSTQVRGSLPHQLVNTAEMGAQIITGFDAGNPLDAIVRGQLALEHHYMKPDMVLYDYDGSVVEDQRRDQEMDQLFNDMLETASHHAWKKKVQKAAGERPENEDVLMDEALKINGTNGTHELEETLCSGRTHVLPLSLGGMMDQLVSEHQIKNEMTPLDMRLLNWHYANLEYANAVNVNQLSLGGWDQDGGNEFEGRHSQIVGGYSQVPRALFDLPIPLEVRMGQAVSKIVYNKAKAEEPWPSALVQCESGEYYNADAVVLSVPLGVLKDGSIVLDPPLPEWKSGAVQRLGFGLLNKVVLVFDHIFWEKERDMFGLLNQPDNFNSTLQQDYALGRGRAYLFWNCAKMTGRPILTALMAGDAAETAETLSDSYLVSGLLEKLQMIFKLPQLPRPMEAIVTRWRKDRFARGSYSYVGPTALPGDYDSMAQPVHNLFFAGEATCITHPATVHGAYISGLRAASQVMDSLVGPLRPPKGVLD